MTIVLLTLGTRGDVEPFVALATGLKQAGHPVRLAAGSEFEGMVRAAGVEYAPLNVSFQEIMAKHPWRTGLGGLGSALKAYSEIKPLMRGLLDDSLKAAEGADLLVYHPKILAGPHIAEKLAIPAFIALALPALSPTTAFPTPLLPFPSVSAFTNRLSHRLVLAGNAASTRTLLDAWRGSRLGLPPARTAGTTMLSVAGRTVPRLYAYSPALVPTPPDWTPDDHVTGYWFSQSRIAYEPPADLVAFLESGAPPLYVGFGSMTVAGAAERTKIIVEALRRANVRAVMSRGWGGLESVNGAEHVHFVDHVSHDWLFPKVRAVVHHGGSGTTHAGLRYGRPTMICPVLGDQPFWARRVHALGLGPKPIPLSRISVEQLAGSFKDVSENQEYAERGRSIAHQLSREDGVGKSLQLIQARLRSR